MMSRKVYTTGQISKICHVAPRTVSKWIDTGRIRGYRIPGSNDRRVTQSDLLDFLRTNNMHQIIREFMGTCKVVLCGLDDNQVQHVKEYLKPPREAVCVGCQMELGVEMVSKPDVVVINENWQGRHNTLRLCESIVKLGSTPLILTGEDTDGKEYEGMRVKLLIWPHEPNDLVVGLDYLLNMLQKVHGHHATQAG